MFIITHKNGMTELLRSRREVEMSFNMNAKQWRQVETGQEIQVDTFLGPCNFRKVRKGELQ